MISAREALTRAAGQLSANPLLRESAMADAALLLMHTLGIPRSALVAHPERPLDRDVQAAYQRVLERRLRFEPVQYILGTQEFYGLELTVTPNVLIPRPETELLVEAMLARLPPDRPLTIADVGTGSGAIALALARHLPLARVTAFDISPAALAVAQHNAATHGLTDRVRLLHADLLEPLAGTADSAKDRMPDTFDVIVSNPPYIPDGERAELHPQVREHEPAGALFAGADGLAVYRRLIPQAEARLVSGGWFAVECGAGQAADIVRLLDGWRPVETLDDLRGIPRMVLARRA